MDNRIYFRKFQIFAIVCSMLSYSNMIVLPMALAKNVHRDAWMSFYLGILYGFLLAYLFYMLIRRLPGKNIFEITKVLCGQWIGGGLNALLILYLLIELIVEMRMFADYVNSSILIRTPMEFILLLTICVLVYFGGGSIIDVSRCAALYVPISLALYMFIPVFMINELDMGHLLPAFQEGSVPIFKGGLIGIGAFADMIAVGAFLNHVKTPKSFYTAMKSGFILSVLVLTVLTGLIITSLGHAFATKFIYVGWLLVQLIHITDFLDRVDLFIISLLIPNLIVKYCVLYLAILKGLVSFTKTKNCKPFNLLMGVFITLTAIVSFSDVEQVARMSTYGTLPFSLIIHVLLIGAVLIGLWIKRNAAKKVNAKNGRGLIMPWIAVLACGAVLAAGESFKGVNTGNGIFLAGLYMTGLVVVAVFTLKEYRRTPEE
jgi:spore germination protein (amino acid permease)